MADNYLGRKMEEYFARPATRNTHKSSGSLLRLLTKNRSYRGYDASFQVREDQLRSIISVNTLLPSARNEQVLRFRAVLGEEARALLPLVHMGGALPELQLPFAGKEPNAFIVIGATVAENRYVDIDLGISVQSMLLRAVELGLNGLCIAAFDAGEVRQRLSLPLEPLLVVAIGRGAEHIELREAHEGDSLAYYREEERHIVPKLAVEHLMM